jgi:hypothetical protein
MQGTAEPRAAWSPLFWMAPLIGLIALTAVVGALVDGGGGAGTATRAEDAVEPALDEPATNTAPAVPADQAPSAPAPATSDQDDQPAATPDTSASSDGGVDEPAVPANTYTKPDKAHDPNNTQDSLAVPGEGQPYTGPTDSYGDAPGEGVAPDGGGEPIDDGLNYGASASCVATPAPNVYMVFEGTSYGLVEIFCADGMSEGEVAQVGATDNMGIAQELPAAVYRDAAGATFTLKPAEPNGSPAMWYRWVPVQ